jgi:hypothetical protein
MPTKNTRQTTHGVEVPGKSLTPVSLTFNVDGGVVGPIELCVTSSISFSSQLSGMLKREGYVSCEECNVWFPNHQMEQLEEYTYCPACFEEQMRKLEED